MKSVYTFKYLFLFFIIFSSCQKEKKRSEEVDTSQECALLINNQIKKLTIENINNQIENQYVYFGKDSLHQMNIKSLVNRHKFFFYFTDQMCPPCVESTVDCIKAVFPEYEKDDGIIFISPDCIVRLRENRYGKKLLVLALGELRIPLEQHSVPFIFTMDENLQINNLHIVNTINLENTLIFLKNIRGN
jgi:hypothetical protein